MIATARRTPPGCFRADRRLALFAAEGAGEGAGFVEVVEPQLDRDPLPFRPHRDLVAERLLELVAGLGESRLDVGIERFAAPSCPWLASQPNPVLGLADGPSTP